MDATGLGTAIFTVVGGFVLFLIGIAITRAIFSIGKIVRLLEEMTDSLLILSKKAEEEKPEKAPPQGS